MGIQGVRPIGQNVIDFCAATKSAPVDPFNLNLILKTSLLAYEGFFYSCALYGAMVFNVFSMAFPSRQDLILKREWLVQIAGHPLLEKTMTQDGNHLMAAYSAGIYDEEGLCHAGRMEFSVEVDRYGHHVKIFQGCRTGKGVLLDLELTDEGDSYSLKKVVSFDGGKEQRLSSYSSEHIISTLQALIPSINHEQRQKLARHRYSPALHDPCPPSTLHLVN